MRRRPPRLPSGAAVLAWPLLPWFGALWASSNYSKSSPFDPRMEDLQVYRRAASAILAGQDPYTLANSFPFIYPPFAALLSLVLAPLAAPVTTMGWAALNAAAVWALVRRLGVRGWRLPVITTALLTLVQPFVHTLGLGQLGILLMVACLVDVLDSGPKGSDAARRTRPRWLPVGLLVGLAAGIKLTPVVFIILLFLLGRRRAGLVAGGTFAATIVIGLVGLFKPAAGYWGRLLHGDSGANPDAFGWLHNQSMLSGWQRFFGVEHTLGGLALSAILVGIALLAARRCVREGHVWLGVGLLGLASSIANPIAWVHHMTWVVPLVIGAWRAGVPMVLRLLALLAALWWQWLPYSVLTGAPWAQAEQHLYSVGEKFLACGGALACMAAVIAAMVVPWPRPSGATTPGGSAHS
ncbi:hypothetical protein GCM10028815_10560 [Mariniluteicoccus flavus]